jgi:hypothetical protein
MERKSMKFAMTLAAAILTAGFASAQPASPPADTSVTVNGKTITIKYSAPSVKGRKIFGEGGQLSKDRTYPVWRAGANNATALHTDADLNIAGLSVPKGDYTLYINVKDPSAWQLIVNKQTGQWGTVYDQAQDLGRVSMSMSKPAAPVETLKWTLTDAGAGKGIIRIEWENHIGTVPFTAK